MSPDDLKGDKKAPMRSPLAVPERRLIDWLTPRFPRAIEGYHLTLLTIPWSAGMILFGWLAQRNIHWLWGSSIMLALQWFTDSLDGALGRYRDTGIPKWGFYMDHLLDFVYMTAVFVGYVFLVDGPARWQVLGLAFVYDVLMVNSFLAFASLQEFKITYLGIGPTEIRLFFILINAALVVFGVGWFVAALPWALGVFCVGGAFIIWRTQRRVWQADMQARETTP